MQFHSADAKHKLTVVAILLGVFAIPFAVQWHALSAVDTRAFIAAGAVIGNSASSSPQDVPPPTNNTSQVIDVAGKTFVGSLAK